MTLMHQALRGRKVSKSIPTPWEMKNMPLHLKAVGQIDWNMVQDAIEPSQQTNFTNMYVIFDSAQLERIWTEFNDKPSLLKWQSPAITPEDHKRMLARGVVELADDREARATVGMFTSCERDKSRRRLITEPAINNMLLDKGACVLPGRDQVVTMLRNTTVTLLDVPWYYGQLGIPTQARNFYRYRYDGREYQCVLAPTGSRQLPCLAQAITTSLTTKAAREFNIPVALTYLDDIAFAGEPQQCTKAAQRFCQLGGELGMTFEPPRSATEYDYIGYHLNHTTKTVSNTQKTINKVQRISLSPSTTLREYIAHIGLLVYASRIVNDPMCHYYHAFKFLRRRCADVTQTLDESCNPWPCLREPIEQWKGVVCSKQSHEQPVAQTTPIKMVYTDACPRGYGCVVFHENGAIEVISGRFEYREDIAVLEARAVE